MWRKILICTCDGYSNRYVSYQDMLCHIPEEQRPQLHHGWNLKSWSGSLPPPRVKFWVWGGEELQADIPRTWPSSGWMKVSDGFHVIGQDHWFRTLLDNTVPTLLVLMLSFKTNPHTYCISLTVVWHHWLQLLFLLCAFCYTLVTFLNWLLLLNTEDYDISVTENLVLVCVILH
jgi:hypothetical protein